MASPFAALIGLLAAYTAAVAQVTLPPEAPPTSAAVPDQQQRPVAPLTIPAAPASGHWSDALKGAWDGTITLPDGSTLSFILNVEGTRSATIAIPEQGLTESPLSEVAIDTAAMVFKLAIPSAPGDASPSWSLTPAADLSTAGGTMRQSGLTLRVDLKRPAPGAVAGPKRPQTPKPPFPYTTREVSYESFDGAVINGTLTIPAAPAESGHTPVGAATRTHPCLLFISGSGIQDRDETIFNHKPFAILADALARAGIASLRVDDRGFGGARDPLGKAATTDTFARDAAAGVEFLARQAEIDPRRIGLLGHSEGGLIAPAVAAAHPSSVSCIVLLAAPGVPGSEVLERQMIAILRAGGASQRQLDLAEARQKTTLSAILAGDRAAARASVRAGIAETNSVTGQPALEGDELESAIDSAMQTLESPWMLHFLTRDPRSALRKTTCPTLVLNGGKDAQVVASQNVPEVVKALLESGNTHVTVRVFPHLNHLFQPCRTGGVDEYGRIETTFDAEALATIVDWTRRVSRR
ncbi:MAG TPA: alpha/beta fold hydrolase [Phycisphaerales bacterium]|nr:alpha/beta fold hydrolase [Phycisphaerales bacterium]